GLHVSKRTLTFNNPDLVTIPPTYTRNSSTHTKNPNLPAAGSDLHANNHDKPRTTPKAHDWVLQPSTGKSSVPVIPNPTKHTINKLKSITHTDNKT
ncbi:hypothetical protein Tsubulata_018883, partial [Turnera subulata]